MFNSVANNLLVSLDPSGMKAVTVFFAICCVIFGIAERKRAAIIFGVLAGIFLAASIWQNFWLLPRSR